MGHMRTAIYARVSTNDQSCDMQLNELRAYAATRGWEAIEYVDSAGVVPRPTAPPYPG
jgi:DNA invertase Pin-like site-specific DNA recombinase